MGENPVRRRMTRRMGDERIWREFYAALLTTVPLAETTVFAITAANGFVSTAAKLADLAYGEYRERFPRAAAPLDDEPDAPETESPDSDSTGQTKKGLQ